MGTKVLLIGGGAREHAIARALVEGGAELYTVMKNRNPGIMRLSRDVLLAGETDVEKVCLYATSRGVELAIVGPEAPLEAGIVDGLERAGVRCASPTRAAARIETSKEFMRSLMERHRLPGRVEYKVFSRPSEVREFLRDYPKGVAVKPVGLTGGKGVKITGDQLLTREDAIAYATEVIEKKVGGEAKVVIEEKLEGEEFTLQAFSDGKRVVPMPAVQDHKRAYEGDVGPNTGGMGSYSQEDHLLPFITKEEFDEGAKIVQRVVDALASEGTPFRGPIYGQFMLTREGPKVVEVNARFGDPEAMNVLAIMSSNLLEACEAMAAGNLNPARVAFEAKATVCKYVVPVGYGTEPRVGAEILVDEKGVEGEGARLYYASVNEQGQGRVLTTSSRSLGVVGIGGRVEEAEVRCEAALRHIKGEFFVRHDIGKPEALRKKLEHMRFIRGR
ncbi:MAG: phosphoribosylamine--glycine ligase [Thermoplasmata archaeon]